MGARMTLSPHMAYCEVEVMKEMTFAQKALARAAGKEYVDTGEIINANVDVAMMDDILGPRIEIAEGLKELEAEVWDKSKVVVISDHYTPPCEIKQAEAVKFTKAWSLEKQVDYHEYEGPCHQVLAEACYDPDCWNRFPHLYVRRIRGIWNWNRVHGNAGGPGHGTDMAEGSGELPH